jgi:hypothetical protein
MALKSVEEAIQAARARGEFDNLEGRGKPQDHSAYFSQPEELRVAHHMLRNAGFVPPEVELLREIGELRERLRACTEEPERGHLVREIDRRQAQIEILRRG